MSQRVHAYTSDGSNGPPPPYLGIGSQDRVNPGHRGYPTFSAYPHHNSREQEELLGTPPTTYGTTQEGRYSQRKPLEWSNIRIVAIIFGSLLVGYFFDQAINSSLHEMERKSWSAEIQAHESLRFKMHHEVIEWQGKRVKWELERDAIETDSRRWAHEREEHDKRVEEERREEEGREQRQREEVERKRQSISWVGLEPQHCLRYGVKGYTAVLANVPLGFNAIEECWRKSVEINGREWSPSSCEDQGVCGRVTGHWHVDDHEAMCTPWWSYFKDKGCVEYGIRRHEAPLEGLRDETNWEAICSTTPANIRGHHYSGPNSCVSWGKYGKWGIWFLEDDSCR